MENSKEWFIIYTKAGDELKVFNTLQKKHIECFCLMNTPPQKTKEKHATTPALCNYLFVHASAAEQALVIQINGVVNFMYWLGRRVVVSEEDMLLLKELTSHYWVLSTEKINVNTTVPARVWETVPIANIAGLDLEDLCIKVSFPVYGFAVIAKESKMSVRVLNIPASENQRRSIAGLQYSYL